MSTLTWIWILSLSAGALLFAAGYLYGRAPGRSRPEAEVEATTEDLPNPFEGELTRLNQALRAEQSARKTEQARALEGLAELDEARSEIERLRAALVRRREPSNLEEIPVPASSTSNLPRMSLSSDGDFGLDRAVRDLARKPGTRCAVVADELGFPIVGFGDSQDPLAALCGLLSEVDEKAVQLLDLGRVRRAILETERGVTVSACAAPYDDTLLTIATLTKGGPTSLEEMRAALDAFNEGLRQGQYRGQPQEITP